jgi:general secretion pathway protein M
MSSVINDNVYPESTSSAAVAASLQAEARRILADAGMDVTNSQVLPARKRDGFDYVAVKVVSRGTLSALEESLGAFARFRPVILIESIDAFPNRQRNADVQVLTVSLDLLSLRMAP